MQKESYGMDITRILDFASLGLRVGMPIRVALPAS
jgi:hypothetical protein